MNPKTNINSGQYSFIFSEQLLLKDIYVRTKALCERAFKTVGTGITNNNVLKAVLKYKEHEKKHLI